MKVNIYQLNLNLKSDCDACKFEYCFSSCKKVNIGDATIRLNSYIAKETL